MRPKEAIVGGRCEAAGKRPVLCCALIRDDRPASSCLRVVAVLWSECVVRVSRGRTRICGGPHYLDFDMCESATRVAGQCCPRWAPAGCLPE